MFPQLHALEADGRPLNVGLIGVGAMGLGIAHSVVRTPGMRLSLVADDRPEATGAARNVAVGAGQPAPVTSQDGLALLRSDAAPLDVLVESTNTVGPAAAYVLAAVDRGAHVVLMNAEVDLAFGQLFRQVAARAGVVVTSDAGDQHGVLARLLDEVEFWGLPIVQAGNIKGFLNRHATADDLLHEAAIRHLNPIQCCAYTDGTKLGIEMALLANARNLPPFVRGMEGPACQDVRQVLDPHPLFPFDDYAPTGHVDYILGAEPGPGVYVVARCDEPLQQRYLEYYKLGTGPYYLFYRPYHLCHLETTRAIALAALRREPVLTPAAGRVADVFAVAKRDLTAGESFRHGIGGEKCYGLIDLAQAGDASDQVPICELEADDAQGGRATLVHPVPKDSPITRADVRFPDTPLHRLLHRQSQIAPAR
ncbi:homoserine dehydrogenase [soil metagenome]